jgi:hypothetical protein
MFNEKSLAYWRERFVTTVEVMKLNPSGNALEEMQFAQAHVRRLEEIELNTVDLTAFAI